MRLVIDKHQRYIAERTCDTARVGQQILNEKPISILYLAYELSGRGTGLDVLKWAKRKNRLPPHVMITALLPNHKTQLCDFLKHSGYVGDGVFFHKSSIH